MVGRLAGDEFQEGAIGGILLGPEDGAKHRQNVEVGEPAVRDAVGCQMVEQACQCRARARGWDCGRGGRARTVGQETGAEGWDGVDCKNLSRWASALAVCSGGRAAQAKRTRWITIEAAVRKRDRKRKAGSRRARVGCRCVEAMPGTRWGWG